MTDMSPYRPPLSRRRSHRPLDLVRTLPSAEELDQHAQRHKGEAADRYTLYTPEQIREETKDARLAVSFDEPIRIRDQAEMIKAAMDVIIGITKDHDLGSIAKRIECRREFASVGQKLSLFNGKTPYGFTKKRS